MYKWWFSNSKKDKALLHPASLIIRFCARLTPLGGRFLFYLDSFWHQAATLSIKRSTAHSFNFTKKGFTGYFHHHQHHRPLPVCCASLSSNCISKTSLTSLHTNKHTRRHETARSYHGGSNRLSEERAFQSITRSLLADLLSRPRGCHGNGGKSHFCICLCLRLYLILELLIV